MGSFGGRPHRWEDDPDEVRPVDCTVCGFTLGPGMDEEELCPGPAEERSGLSRGKPLERSGSGLTPSPLRARGKRREERRRSSVTGEKLQMGPACDWVRRRRCVLSGRVSLDGRRHECTGPVQACHLRPRGRGYGDWVVEDGEVLLAVLPGCPWAHDRIDGRVPGHGGRTEFEETWGVDLWDEAARLQRRCPLDPPEHYRMKADEELV